MSRESDLEFARQLGGRIRVARERMGVSQEHLAKMAGLHRSTIYLTETGRRNPMASTLWFISCALDRPIEDLTEGMEWVSGSEKKKGRWIYDGEPGQRY